MTAFIRPDPAILVIFGAGGDLTWRKLVPALFHLFLDKWLPERFAVIGVEKRPMTDEGFRARLWDGVEQFSRRKPADEAAWAAFASHFGCVTADFGDPATYTGLAGRLSATEEAWQAEADRALYLAVPPSLMGTIVEQAGPAGLAQDRRRVRIVVESPSVGTGSRREPSTTSSLASLSSPRPTALIITWAKRRSRTSWPFASRTRCSSRSGIAATLTTSRSPWRSMWGWSTGGATTTTPGPCAI